MYKPNTNVYNMPKSLLVKCSMEEKLEMQRVKVLCTKATDERTKNRLSTRIYLLSSTLCESHWTLSEQTKNKSSQIYK